MTICVHSVHWFKVEEKVVRITQTKIYRALWIGEHALRRRTVAFEECLTWNETFTMSCKLANVDLIEIQERHSGLDCTSRLCLNFNHWANHRPGHLQQPKVQLYHQYPSHSSDSDALGCRSEVCPNDYDIPPQAAALPWISEPMFHILTLELNNRVDSVDCGMGLAIMQSWWYVPGTLRCTWTLSISQQYMRDSHEWASRVSNSDTCTQYRLDCLFAKLIWQIRGAGSDITQLKTYADDSPMHLNLNQMAANAAALPGISHVGISYSNTAIPYRHDIIYCQIGLANLQCVIYRNETHGMWHMARIPQCTSKWLNCARYALLTTICVRSHRFPVNLEIATDKWFEALRCIILNIQLRSFILTLARPGTCNLASQLTSSLISH